jgi:AraC-like DNA-binding protein
MSPDGHPAVRVGTFPLAAGGGFERHSHDQHQVAWAPRGVLTVATDAGTWVLPPTRALWLPSGAPHQVQAVGATVFRPLYLEPAPCPIRWPEPAPIVVAPVLAALIDHLGHADLEPDQRGRAESVLYDLFRPAGQASIEVPWPVDPRARAVADALAADPADPRGLAAWGRHVGASARTLARAFQSDTGLGFQRWRTTLRLRAALPHLALGETIATAASRAGYQTPSAFVAAFRRETGVTPGAYFHAQP